jgi:hypothetical protein
MTASRRGSGLVRGGFVHQERKSVNRGRRVPWIVLLVAASGFSCATPVVQPTLTLEQHTLRIPLTVGATGYVSLAERPPLIGRIDLSPILKAEGIQPGTTRPTIVQLMVHYGRIYVVADAFHAVWELTPQPGSSTATYRQIPIARGPDRERLKGVRLSQYGSSRSTCLRLDRTGGAPVFITSTGEARDVCP